MGLYDIVRYEGNQQDWLIYKYKETEFNTKSKLIVSQGQVAILVHNGQIEKIWRREVINSTPNFCLSPRRSSRDSIRGIRIRWKFTSSTSG